MSGFRGKDGKVIYMYDFCLVESESEWSSLRSRGNRDEQRSRRAGRGQRCQERKPNHVMSAMHWRGESVVRFVNHHSALHAL